MAAAKNVVLRPVVPLFGAGDQAPAPPPSIGQFRDQLDVNRAQCRAQRVQLAGAALNTVLVHPGVEVFEQLYRRLPSEGIHNPAVSPQRPFRIPMGAFKVPPQMGLLVFDLRPDLYRFVGVDAFDTVPFEERRFGRQMGWEVRVDGVQLSNLKFELEPSRRTLSTTAYTDPLQAPGVLAPPAAFAQARANSFAAAAGSGLGTLPQRTERYGAKDLPLSLYLQEGQVWEANAIIFRRIVTPIAFLEFDFAGILMSKNTIEELFACMNPV